MPPEQRREQLLDAAIAVIARDGYAGVSIDAIAREAGVTRPVVYGVFAGLGPLLFALLDRQEQRALSQLLGALPEDLGTEAPAPMIAAVVRGLIATVSGDPLTWRPILLAAEETPPVVRERIAHDREVVRARIQALLELGLSRRAGPEVDSEIASHALIGAAEHFGRIIIEDPESFDGERLVRAVEAMLSALRV
jgi:AcrR family transcriptional regulator